MNKHNVNARLLLSLASVNSTSTTKDDLQAAALAALDLLSPNHPQRKEIAKAIRVEAESEEYIDVTNVARGADVVVVGQDRWIEVLDKAGE